MMKRVLSILPVNVQQAYVITFFSIVIHLMLLILPGVNLEFAFAGAVDYFKTSNPVLLEQYFSYQANTLGLPYFTYLISNIFPQIDVLLLLRLVNLAGVPFLMVGIYRICKYLNIANFNVIFLLIILNPLVWTFSGRATADFLPVALGVFAISLALGSKQFLLKSLLAGVFLGVAAVFKYHALCLLVFLVALLLPNEDRCLAIKKIIVVTLISIILVGFYLFKVNSLFGFWLTPDKYQTVHHLSVSSIMNNFILYTGFLGLIVLPTFLFSEIFWHAVLAKWKLVFSCLVVVVALSFYVLQDGGELNLGPLDTVIGDKLRTVVLSLIFVATVTLIFISEEIVSKTSKTKLTIVLALLIVLFVFSSSRPAQRYLLFVLPFFIMIIPNSIVMSRKIVFATVGLFILGNTFIEYSRWATGTAANLMVKQLKSQHLIQHTSPGVIEPHVGNHFYTSRQSDKLYVVAAGKSNDAIITVNVGSHFLGKSFSLVKINSKLE